MKYDEIIRFFKLAMTFILTLAICAMIHLLLAGCSRKTTSVSEDYTHTTRTDTIHVIDSLSQLIEKAESWWAENTTKTTYSKPDSTGQQYIVSVEQKEAKGGKVVHDTITIHVKDSAQVQVRDSIIYKYNKVKESKKTSLNSYIIFVLIIIVILVLHLMRKND